MLRRLTPSVIAEVRCNRPSHCFSSLQTCSHPGFFKRQVFRIFAPIVRTFRKMATLETLKFDNHVLRELPMDPCEEKRIRPVTGACFSKVQPTPVTNPEVVVYSKSAMELLDLPESELTRPDTAEYFSGNKLLPGSTTAAHCYCGHQFGVFAGQLGDGAAMYLGEVINKKDERWEIQFKGSGLTPYSRTADGRKVLRSTIREFLCSEAMHHLGVPTTRAGTCVTSDTTVIRDIFYNGNPKEEKCTIVLRIAPTFLRFGSFEIFKPTDPESGRKGPSVGKTELLHQMLEYTIKTFYTEIWEAHNAVKQTMYLEFFKEVVRRTARLVAEWQCVGWCHGVLNTDNMSIVGLTIDYGPYGFMDKFDPNFICNGSDDGGRYTYKNQPEVCKWNCVKLAEAIKDAIPLPVTRPAVDEVFDEVYADHYKMKMRKKLGLMKELPEDGDLVESLMDTMQATSCDFTNSFRCLSRVSLPGGATAEQDLQDVTDYLLTQCTTVEELRKANQTQMDPRQLQMLMMLSQSNPGLLPMLGRGFLSFTKELERMEKQEEMKDLTQEIKEGKDRDAWTKWLTKYMGRLAQEVAGEQDVEAVNRRRVELMNSNNPRIVLRNYIAQNAIAAAEKGDYSEVKQVLKLLEDPYSSEIDAADLVSKSQEGEKSVTTDDGAASSSNENADGARTFTEQMYDNKPPMWSSDLRVT